MANVLSSNGSVVSAQGQLDYSAPVVANMNLRIYDQNICNQIGAAFDPISRSCQTRPQSNRSDGNLDLRELYPQGAYYFPRMSFTSTSSLTNEANFYGFGPNGITSPLSPHGLVIRDPRLNSNIINGTPLISEFRATFSYKFTTATGAKTKEVVFLAKCQIPKLSMRAL